MIELLKRHDNAPSIVCESTNAFNGDDVNLRILSVFMILISSAMGSFFPLLSSKYSFIRMPDWCFFIAKFFGSGVIIATAFIHLLAPAAESLGNECLTGIISEYSWAFAICMMSLFSLFFMEILTHYFMSKAEQFEGDSSVHTHMDNVNCSDSSDEELEKKIAESNINQEVYSTPSKPPPVMSAGNYNSQAGANHFSHGTEHQDPEQVGTLPDENSEKYMSQIIAVSILELGVVFHSVFVGLSLAVSGNEFKTLFVVLIFHQMFEGLGLGTRLAETNWPKKRRATPWVMALAFALTTPVATAIGLGIRETWIPGSRTSLITSGVFDSISAGILIYTGLVELMAHEFLFSNQFKGPNGFKRMLYAYLVMCLGAALMALLGKWA